MTGLAPHTGSIFDAVTKMESIKNYVLVGGTALSMQINNRQSENLDFMCWRQRKDQKMEVEWRKIDKELSAMLTNGTRFNRDARFDQLQPKYEVTPQDIELYIKSLLNQ